MESDDVIAEIAVLCAGTTLPQRKFIAEATNVLSQVGLKVEIHATGTNVEGPIDKILVAVKHIRERCHEMGAPKVDIHLNIISRQPSMSLEKAKQKIASH